jgi:O-antigen/teichoic acid export membrane protein
VLKGAGRHRFLAWVNLSTGLVNVALSVALIGLFGLPGVAIGTLIPIAAASIFVVQPAACRRVGLPLRVAVTKSILPAIWPAFVVAAALMVTRHLSSGTFLALCLQATVAGVLYLVLLLGVAIGKKERELYVGKLLELAGRRRLTPHELGTARQRPLKAAKGH